MPHVSESVLKVRKGTTVQAQAREVDNGRKATPSYKTPRTCSRVRSVPRLGYVTEHEFDTWVKPENMIGPAEARKFASVQEKQAPWRTPGTQDPGWS